MKKPNPVLAAYEAKLDMKYKGKLEVNSEFDRIAAMIAANEELQVGPGRAKWFLNAMIAEKVDLSNTILKDDGDPEISHTKRDVAARLKEIFGDSWKEVQAWFPFVKDYWEE